MARMAAAMVLVDPVLHVRGVAAGQQVMRHQPCRLVYGTIKQWLLGGYVTHQNVRPFKLASCSVNLRVLAVQAG